MHHHETSIANIFFLLRILVHRPHRILKSTQVLSFPCVFYESIGAMRFNVFQKVGHCRQDSSAHQQTDNFLVALFLCDSHGSKRSRGLQNTYPVVRIEGDKFCSFPCLLSECSPEVGIYICWVIYSAHSQGILSELKSQLRLCFVISTHHWLHV